MVIDPHSEFQKLLDYHGIKYFDVMELFYKGSSNSYPGSSAFNKNTIPPIHLWYNIIPTVKVLERLRTELDSPIIIHSAYRSEAYNKAVGGATNSQHKQFTAVDFTVSGNGSPEDWAAKLIEYRNEDLFQGGIGIYKTFVHLDTRGSNATW